MNLMKKMALVAACMLVSATFVACNDDTAVAADVGETVESSSSEESELSSSSEESDVVEQSSSSEESVDDEPSSSSEISSSETVDDGESSSSSETVENAESSSSSKKLDCGPIPDDEEFVMTYKVTYDSIVDARDGRVYKTVTFWSLSPEIGPFKCEEFSQTWMAENLNYADSSATPSLLGNNWCYDNDEANCDAEGRLYTWAAATSVCPGGWHLPTLTEWQTLFSAVAGGPWTVGNFLKSTSGWIFWNGRMDAFGFSALPTGYRDYKDEYRGGGLYTGFWSSTESDSDNAYFMNYIDDFGYLEIFGKNSGFSVRCLKN